MAPDRQALEISHELGGYFFDRRRAVRQARFLCGAVVERPARAEHRHFALQGIDQIQRAHDAMDEIGIVHAVRYRLRKSQADLIELVAIGGHFETTQIFLRATNAAISGVCMPSLSKSHVPFSKTSWAKRFAPVIAAFRKPEP